MAEIIKGLPLSEYHDPANGYVSHSRLHDFLERGPGFFRGKYITGEIARKETPSLIFGQAFEDYFLGGEEHFRSLYAVRPAHIKNGTTTAAKQWKAAQPASMICLTDEDWECIKRMTASLHTCKKGMEFVDRSEQQVTFRGNVFGLNMQSRPDCVRLAEFGTCTIDLKTTRDINDFLKRDGSAVWRFGYHTQAALARRLLAANGYENASAYLLVVESQEPYNRAFIQLKEDGLAWADRVLEEECAKLKECIDTDTWPLGPDEIVQLGKPRWVKDEQVEAQP